MYFRTEKAYFFQHSIWLSSACKMGGIFLNVRLMARHYWTHDSTFRITVYCVNLFSQTERFYFYFFPKGWNTLHDFCPTLPPDLQCEKVDTSCWKSEAICIFELTDFIETCVWIVTDSDALNGSQITTHWSSWPIIAYFIFSLKQELRIFWHSFEKLHGNKYKISNILYLIIF